jgi:LmbE family N-acetylglucosaminyl deacetylase
MKTEDQLIPFHGTDPTGKRVLVLAPHPDDETIGCGGTLALHAAAGDPVRVVILTNGAKGDMSGRFAREDYIALRRQETLAACACLGIADVMFLDHEDRELAYAPTLLSDLTAWIDTYLPDVIYAPSPLEFHPDHRTAADLAVRAVRFCRTQPQLFFYEVGQPVQVDMLVDITGVVDRKNQAIQQYRSQLAERPYDDVALALNRFRSLTLSQEVTHAEGFVRASCFEPETEYGNWSRWPCQPAMASLSNDSRYEMSVIVRTQGIRFPFLKEALTSIASQSRPCIAVVVAHAGAEMLETIASVCRDVPSLSWVLLHAAHTENKRGYPLNVGLEYVLTFHSETEAVAFLDDDDILYPDFSARMLETLRNTAADVVCAASNRCIPGQAAEEGYRPISFLNLFVINFIPINTYVIRLVSLRNTPVFFDETMDVVEDWHFLLQLIQHGFRFEAVMEVLSEFRIISDGNKKIKDDPDKWETAYAYIYNFMQTRSFLMNGPMLQSLMTDQYRREAEQQETAAELRKRLNELESALAEKVNVSDSPPENIELSPSDLTTEIEPELESVPESVLEPVPADDVCRQSWLQKIGAAVNQWVKAG